MSEKTRKILRNENRHVGKVIDDLITRQLRIRENGNLTSTECVDRSNVGYFDN